MTALIARVALRYIAAILIYRGLITPEDGSFIASDPDMTMLIETGLGFAFGAIAEGWLWLSKRMGWEREAGQ